MRMSKAIQEFLADRQAARKSPNTLRAYESDLQRMAARASHDTVLAFTPALVLKVLHEWSADGLKLSTLHRRQTAIREFGKWGRKRKYWVENPMDDGTIPTIARPRLKPRPFNYEEARRLLALALSPDEDLARTLLVYTGLRISSICALRLANISWEPAELRVVIKGGDEQVISLAPILRDKLYAHVTSHKGMRPYDPILAYRNGKPMNRRTVEKWTQRWGALADVPDCTPHRFRHLFGTRLLEQTKDLRLVQEAMGHRSIQSTMIYTEVTNARLRDAIAGLTWDPPRPEGEGV